MAVWENYLINILSYSNSKEPRLMRLLVFFATVLVSTLEEGKLPGIFSGMGWH